MGKGGVAPEYFLYRMQWHEIRLYLDGMQMRDRSSWEQHRSLVHSISSMFCKNISRDAHSFMPLPWDTDKETKHEFDESYVREMQDMIRRENERLQPNKAHG